MLQNLMFLAASLIISAVVAGQDLSSGTQSATTATAPVNGQVQAVGDSTSYTTDYSSGAQGTGGNFEHYVHVALSSAF